MAERITKSGANFTKKLYQILSKEEGNVFFSPIGLHICLSMIHQGAEGETAKILSQILELPSDPETTASEYEFVMNQLNATEKVALLMANKIYAKENKEHPVVLCEDFEEVIRKKFDGDIELIDFADKSKAVEIINKWVEDRTKNTIQNMINEELIDEEETAMMLINTIYFKGKWANEFSPSSTSTHYFFSDEEKKIEVQMMKNIGRYKFKSDQELGAKILQMPYEEENVSMIIILPFEKNGIQNLEEKLSVVDPTQATQDLKETRVYVHLPKFKIGNTMDLKDILKEMGLQNIFDRRKANFRKIIELHSGENLCVGSIIQKSFIDVNEEGTEASAATVVEMIKPKCGVKFKGEHFVVNHPAIFMLVFNHKPDEMTILFFGRLSHPQY